MTRAQIFAASRRTLKRAFVLYQSAPNTARRQVLAEACEAFEAASDKDISIEYARARLAIARESVERHSTTTTTT